ncbi:MAG: hypothetical protein SOR91_05805, partial [Hornefia butyriciproducens]|uniref:hypothetical protein n=1 Tax=Hornefia butyriciproducens TaxID=2652293 RepID=UPI002A74C27C
EAEFIFTQISAPSFCHAMNPYWLIEFYSISGLIPIPDFMKPASAGRLSLKCGSDLFIPAHHRAYRSVHGGSTNLTSDTPCGVVV